MPTGTSEAVPHETAGNGHSFIFLPVIRDVQPEAEHLMGVSGKAATLTQSQRDKCAEWTLAVKGVLFKLGRKLGCEVYSSGKGFSHELLLDVPWCYGALASTGIALACESEWNYAHAVSEDFQKLIVIKAPLKLLTYSGREPMAEEIRARVKQTMERYPYHVAGEEYIFVGLDFGIGYAHRYTVPCDGRQTSIVLEPLDMRSAVGA